MTKITLRADCGNSPKNILLQKFAVAGAKRDRQFMLRHVTKDIQWILAGKKTITGLADFAKALKQLEGVSELALEQVITHGKAGAVNGIRVLKSGKVFAFCEVYEFSNAKATHISKITTYINQIKYNPTP